MLNADNTENAIKETAARSLENIVKVKKVSSSELLGIVADAQKWPLPFLI